MLRTAALSAFRVTAGEYDKLHFSESDALTATFFIWGICIGIIAAALYALYRQQTIGRAVRALLRAEALSKERAKTAEELGLTAHPLALRELSRGASLRTLVQRIEDGDTVRYFIREEDKYRADIRFDKKENNPVSAIITILLSVALALLLIRFFPAILGMINAIL